MNQLVKSETIEILESHYCQRCQAVLLCSDNFCRICGGDCREQREFSKVAHRDLPMLTQPTGLPITRPVRLLNYRLAVISAILLLGPLGLPALWLSNQFSKWTKIGVTLLYLLLTTILPLAIIWYWLDYSLWPLVETFQLETD